MRALIGILMIAISLWVLETARTGIEMTRQSVGQTPIVRYAQPDADGPVVVMAHGFAGSQQMMQGYALPLARAGYRVYAFDFHGHGRNGSKMSGDISSIDGTTKLLVNQTKSVITSVATPDQPTALLGHSMATDILVRTAGSRLETGPLVLVSAFSEDITATTPPHMLLIAGAWEKQLSNFAKESLEMVSPGAALGQTVTKGDVIRRAVAAPFSEHVSVLHSRVARREALDWLDQSYGRRSDITILPTGWAILGLLGGLVLTFRRVAALSPPQEQAPLVLTPVQTAIVLLVPAILTPFVAVPLKPAFLPVLVADYLGLHLFIYGALQLALLWFWGARFGRFSAAGFFLLLLWSALFGIALDRYAANFWPVADRYWIILVLMVGALPAMLADTLLAKDAVVWRRLAIRASFLVSLGIAVSLDFTGLLFLIMIAPVMVLFYLVFGTMGRDIARRAGPLSSGIALGLVLAWALGVSFPMIAT